MIEDRKDEDGKMIMRSKLQTDVLIFKQILRRSRSSDHPDSYHLESNMKIVSEFGNELKKGVSREGGLKDEQP